jgi:hypothetical protein
MADGATQGDHLASAARQWEKLGRKPKAAAVSEGPAMPDLLRYLWDWFCEVSLGLSISGMAPPVVTWEGLLAWSRLRRLDLEPWEAGAIVTMGTIRASVYSEKLPGQK